MRFEIPLSLDREITATKINVYRKIYTTDKELTKMIKIPRHVKKEDITEMLGISISTLDRIRKNDPDFPDAIKISRRAIRFSEKGVKEWIEKKYSQVEN